MFSQLPISKLSQKLRTAGLLAFALLLTFTASSSFAQNGGPAFEVATVRPSSLDVMKIAEMVRAGQTPAIGTRIGKSQVTYTFLSLRDLIIIAYDVKQHQISGPEWLADAGAPRFDIVAKLPDGATPDQAPKMLQALLAERFRMTVHRETKDQPMMALVVGSGGLKLKEVPADESSDFDPSAPLKPGEQQTDTPEGPVRTTVQPNGSAVVNMGKRGMWIQEFRPTTRSLHLEGKGVTLSAFADIISQLAFQAGRGAMPIVDRTGLKGNYVVSIDVALADLLAMAQALGAPVPTPGPGAAPDPGPSGSVFDAVSALGLKLESRKEPGEQLVIDKAEKMPTEN